MTTARSHPPVHTYLGDKDPMEMVDTRAGRMERWRADALLVGETSAAIQARHDAVTEITDIEAEKRELAAGQAALTIERATFDAERRTFADQVHAAIDYVTTQLDRLEKMKADQLEEPLATPPVAAADEGGNSDPPSKQPDPPQPLESDQSELPTRSLPAPAANDQKEFADPELPQPPPVTAQPVSPGLDKE